MSSPKTPPTLQEALGRFGLEAGVTFHQNLLGVDTDARGNVNYRFADNISLRWFKMTGTLEWRKNELPHRENGAARMHADGTSYWMIEGKLHRAGRPAVIRSDGTREWWVDNQLHRAGGAPAVIDPNSPPAWYLHGETGPAVSERCLECAMERKARRLKARWDAALRHADTLAEDLNTKPLGTVRRRSPVAPV